MADDKSAEDQALKSLSLSYYPRMDIDFSGVEIIQTDFDLEAAIRSMASKGRRVDNPYIPPRGCPVNELPTELLSCIFMEGLDTDADDDDDDDDWEDDDDDALSDYSLGHAFSDGEDEEEHEGADDGAEIEEGADEGKLSLKLKKSRSRSSSPRTVSEHERTLPFQVLVSHVCKHWRSVALGTPSLWTNITLADQQDVPRIAVWIERSKGLPIDIDIDYGVVDDVDEMEEDNDVPNIKHSNADLQSMLQIITPHADRWRTFQVTVSDYTRMMTVLDFLAKIPAAPLLKVLELYHDDELGDTEHFQPAELSQRYVLFNNNAPNLLCVSLWGVHIDWDASTILSGLEDLELAYHAEDVRMSYPDFVQILRASPNLHTLALCLSGPAGLPSEWTSYDGDPPTITELPALKNLLLAYHEPEYIAPLLSILSLPNLTSLALDFDSGDFSAFARQLAAPSKNNSRSLLAGLENLKIAGLPCDHATVGVMYGQLSNLKSLTLSCTFVDELFFDRLRLPLNPSLTAASAPASFEQAMAKETLPMYCPHLESISTSGIDGRKMRSFVEARNAAGVPVKFVRMSEDDEVNKEDDEWLREHTDGFEYFEPSDEESDLEVEIGDMEDDES